MPVVDPQEVTKSPKLPRKLVDVNDLTAIGKEARRRAIVECERRFCGSDAEEITGRDVEVTDRELLATLLDIRTKGGKHLTRAQRLRAKQLLIKAHSEFEARCEEFAQQQEEEASRAAPSPAAPWPAPASEPPRTPQRDPITDAFAGLGSARTPPSGALQEKDDAEKEEEERLAHATRAAHDRLAEGVSVFRRREHTAVSAARHQQPHASCRCQRATGNG